MVIRRLMKELAELKINPPEGIRVATNDENFLDVTGIIEGPGMYQQYSLWALRSATRVFRGDPLCWRLFPSEIPLH